MLAKIFPFLDKIFKNRIYVRVRAYDGATQKVSSSFLCDVEYATMEVCNPDLRVLEELAPRGIRDEIIWLLYVRLD